MEVRPPEGANLSRGRLKKRLHPSVISHITEPYLTAALRHLEHHYYVHEAHVVMLQEQRLLDAESSATLLKGLARLRAGELTATPLDPETDLYMNLESRLIGLTGDVGGMMHIGRSRNDLYATVTRMAVRDELLQTLELLLQLIDSMLRVAEQHKATTMTGYTHWQHAQPVTVAHYLTGITQSLLRDADRLKAAYAHTNLCPMGAAALSGTGFPIDRERVSNLLGFSEVLENTYDAVAARDFVAEAAAALAVSMVTLSRVAEDLIIWSTQEFAMVDIPEDFAITSSIMPQKKNPFVLEHIKGRAGHVIAALTGVLTILKGTSFSHSREVGGESGAGILNAFSLCHGSLSMMSHLLPSLGFNAALMERRASESFCTVTDLVDLIVRKKGIPFRTAHQIVAQIVNTVQQQGMSVDAISTALISQIARRITGSELTLPESDLREALNANRNVAAREVKGGPGPAALTDMISRQHAYHRDHRTWLAEQRSALAGARAASATAADSLVNAAKPSSVPQ